ncbi:MAG: methyltransferase domain-containing protein [Desulfobulbaceae bacterium]|nr:methyltransferase domain-containing protein [Desulfobulbaceae bacterium]
MEKKYLMENGAESFRLDVKVEKENIRRQAKWAGLQPGMRVGDFGCGPGNITSILHELVQPGGSVVGVDGSTDRLEYARTKYGRDGIFFEAGDLAGSLHDLGEFDFIWVRFVLEYHLSGSFDLVRNFTRCLQPGGILCLSDLDHNPFVCHGTPPRLERTFSRIMAELQEKHDFDPFIGRKLYSFLYDLGFDDIDVNVEIYKTVFGEISDGDVYNILKKIEVAPKRINFAFDEYEGGFEEFYAEAKTFFTDPRRFTYAPLVICRGKKKG